MKTENFSERRIELEGWPVNLTSYRIGPVYHCKADNVQPGACIARAAAPTREEAERQALEQARRRLARTERHTV